MRIVVQRVREASIHVNEKPVASIGNGLLALVGLGREDADLRAWASIETVLAKMLQLRIFPDDDNHMNVSLADYGGEILLVSQFTLYADCRKGRRPSFHLASTPDLALPLYQKICVTMEALLPGKVQSGIFGADMNVSLINWGPVTIILDSANF